MSGIKSTSIVVNQCYLWSGEPWQGDAANATDWAMLLDRSSRLTLPPITVAYCGMSPYPCALGITETVSRQPCAGNWTRVGGSWVPSSFGPNGLISRIAEMDWSSIRQVAFQPCSADLICARLWGPGKSIGSARGQATTWSQPFASMLQRYSQFDVWQWDRMAEASLVSPRRWGLRSSASLPSAVGIGSMLVGLCPGLGASVSG